MTIPPDVAAELQQLWSEVQGRVAEQEHALAAIAGAEGLRWETYATVAPHITAIHDAICDELRAELEPDRPDLEHRVEEARAAAEAAASAAQPYRDELARLQGIQASHEDELASLPPKKSLDAQARVEWRMRKNALEAELTEDKDEVRSALEAEAAAEQAVRVAQQELQAMTARLSDLDEAIAEPLRSPLVYGLPAFRWYMEHSGEWLNHLDPAERSNAMGRTAMLIIACALRDSRYGQEIWDASAEDARYEAAREARLRPEGAPEVGMGTNGVPYVRLRPQYALGPLPSQDELNPPTMADIVAGLRSGVDVYAPRPPQASK